MPAHTPQELHELTNRYFNAGDIDSLMDLFLPESVMLAGPGQVVSGIDGIRDAFQGFMAMADRLDMQPPRVLQSGDVALILAKWTINGKGPDGSPVVMHGDTTDVARRQADGTWKMVIDSPFGVEGM